MKCPSCNKFCGFEPQDPEVEIEVSIELAETSEDKPAVVDNDKATATVTGTVRLVLNTECCSEEAKEATFDVEVQVDVERAEGCICDLTVLEVEGDDAEVTDRMESTTTKVMKRGPQKGMTVTKPIPYQFQKRFWGVEMTIALKCQCGKTTATEDWKDEVQASGMEEMC